MNSIATYGQLHLSFNMQAEQYFLQCNMIKVQNFNITARLNIFGMVHILLGVLSCESDVKNLLRAVSLVITCLLNYRHIKRSQRIARTIRVVLRGAKLI